MLCFIILLFTVKCAQAVTVSAMKNVIAGVEGSGFETSQNPNITNPSDSNPVFPYNVILIVIFGSCILAGVIILIVFICRTERQLRQEYKLIFSINEKP
jgi:hypothetical protein